MHILNQESIKFYQFPIETTFVWDYSQNILKAPKYLPRRVSLNRDDKGNKWHKILAIFK